MSPVRGLITQSNYIPWKGYFDAINLVDRVILLDDVQYTRRDWRNRNRIKTPQGLRWLTIPIEVRGKFRQTIVEARVSDPRWNVRHWETLCHAYRRAPYFDYWHDFLASLYAEEPSPFLSRINERFIRAICQALGISTSLSRSSDYEVREGANERIISLCRQAGITDYYTGPAARSYLDEALFSEHGITVHWLDFSGYPEYPQLHGPFEHSVTILDLLVHTGPEATSYMKSFSRPGSLDAAS